MTLDDLERAFILLHRTYAYFKVRQKVRMKVDRSIAT